MDARHFDALARVLSGTDSRRRVLALIATLPALGGLLGIFSPEDTDARGRRKRRKKRHKHGKGRTRNKRKPKKKCKPASCVPYTQCDGNACATSCATDAECVAGSFCDGGQCVGDQADGEPCANGGQCESGFCVDSVCCDGACDGACQACDLAGSVGTCTPLADGATCGGGNICCGDLGICTNTDTDPDNCGACGKACSGATPACVNGACACGDVCASGCQFSSVQAAIDAAPAGSTIRLCAGTYAPITIGKNLTLIGAGGGSDPASNTILDGGGTSRVATIFSGVTVTLQGLRITRGRDEASGGGIENEGNLTMMDCTITDNRAGRSDGTGFGYGGGIENSPSGTLSMTNCIISNNSANVEGGGIHLLQGAHALSNCTFSGNTAGFRGGAVKLNNGGTVTFNGCTIGPGNNAPDAAVVVWNSYQLTLDATTVSGNIGTTAGGIRNLGASVTLQNGSTVSGNTPTNCAGTITGSGCAA